MNYLRIYNLIIENRKNNIYNGYTEKHHILPKCLGGTNDADNLVKLSAKEHYICHLLLTKIYKYNTPEYHKMVHAFICMVKGIHNDRHITSNQYTKLKIMNAKYLSETRKGKSSGMIWICNHSTNKSRMIYINDEIPKNWERGNLNGKGIKRSIDIIKKIRDSKAKLNKTGINNKRYGIKWFHNIELQINKKFNINEIVPVGWNIGRVNDWDLLNTRKCKICDKLLLTNNKDINTCSKECRDNRESLVGYIWIYNIETLSRLRIKDIDIIPDGYSKGRGPRKIKSPKVSNTVKLTYKWIYNLDTGESIQVLKDTIIDDNWANGRITDIEAYKLKITQSKIAKEKLLLDNKIYYTKLYEIYKSNGWAKMKELTNYSLALSTFLRLCPLYVDDYVAQPGKKRSLLK